LTATAATNAVNKLLFRCCCINTKTFDEFVKRYLVLKMALLKHKETYAAVVVVVVSVAVVIVDVANVAVVSCAVAIVNVTVVVVET